MMYMFPEKERQYQEKFNVLVKDFLEAVPSSMPIVFELGKKVIAGDFYKAMRNCRKLLRYEEEVLKNVAE